MKVSVFALTLAMLPLCPAFAASERAPQSERRGQPDFLALGVGVAPDYMGANEYRPIPFGGAKVSVPGMDLYWRGLALRADLLAPRTGGQFVGGIDGRFQFGRDDVESAAVNSLPDIDATFELGGFLGYRISGINSRRDSMTFSVDALFDVGGVHDGYTLSPRVAYSTPLTDKLRANISANVKYADDNYMDTYFSVTPKGSLASGLPAFTAGSGFYQAGLAIGLNYELTEKWGVFTQLNYSRLTGDGANSPIVDIEGDANQFLGGIALSYTF